MSKFVLGALVFGTGSKNVLKSYSVFRLLYASCPVDTGTQLFQQKRFYSRQETKGASDKIEKWFDPKVQQLLKDLTGADYKKVFRKRKVGQKLKEPKYKFMTEAQLNEALIEARETASKLLEMPPVCRPRKPINKVLSFDPHVQGTENSTIVFTDITIDNSDRNRLIVARDPDGTLRQASWEERDKMNSIYFPKAGRNFTVPEMFKDVSMLQYLLDKATPEENTYEYILDRLCVQFEPDDPLFISNSEKTYETIDVRRHYDFLKSTRHYGPLVFFLARTRRMDNLLIFNIQEKRFSSDALPLLSLFHELYPESNSKRECDILQNDLQKIRKYIELDSVKRSELELIFNAYEESEKSRIEHEEGLKRAHGL